MVKKYVVTLTDAERQMLKGLISAGKGAARRMAHARILLKADQALPDNEIAVAVEVTRQTVERVRKRFVEEGMDAALDPRRAERPRKRKLDGRQEAQLIALACGEPPSDQARWTLRLLADKMVELEYVDRLSYETVRRTLKKTKSSRG
jgi:transposase